MDETYFLYSEKGKRNISERKSRKRGGKAKYRGISNDQICVLVARDRQKMTFSGVLGRGRIRTTKLDEAMAVIYQSRMYFVPIHGVHSVPTPIRKV